MQTVTPHIDPQCVLVVDDEPDFLEDISLNLKRTGYRVLAHTDARSAISEGGKTHVDIVLADIRLPGPYDGWQVIQEVRAHSPEADCIAITAFFEPEFREKSQRLGLFACVEKPISLDLLGKLIRSCSENQRLRKELCALRQAGEERADHEKADSERALLQAAMDALPFSVFVTRPDGEPVFMNSTGRMFLESANPDSASQSLPAEILQLIQKSTSNIAPGRGETSQATSSFLAPDGSDFRIRSWSIDNEENEPLAIVFVEPPRIAGDSFFDSESARVWLPIMLRLAK